jgi:hypothetical protein
MSRPCGALLQIAIPKNAGFRRRFVFRMTIYEGRSIRRTIILAHEQGDAMRNIVVAPGLLILLALCGWGLNTQFVHLSPPISDRVVGELKPIVIDSISDDRNFETIPEGNQPRINSATVGKLGPERLTRTVSGFPHGGKVILLDDKTVPDLMLEIITAALHSKGYEVVPSSQAPSDAPHLQIKVTEFWAYLPFSFGRSLTWTMQLKAWVATDITIKTQTLEREFTIKGYGAHIVQAYKIENVQQAYDLALADYQSNLDSKLSNSF